MLRPATLHQVLASAPTANRRQRQPDRPGHRRRQRQLELHAGHAAGSGRTTQLTVGAEARTWWSDSGRTTQLQRRGRREAPVAAAVGGDLANRVAVQLPLPSAVTWPIGLPLPSVRITVGFFLTTGFLGMMYYFVPKQAERPVMLFT